MTAIYKQPVSAAIQASSYILQTYKSGVITSANCGTDIDQAVQIVGYDSDASTPYYIVRMSWSAAFADEGYIKIEMIDSGDGICGLNEEVATVDVESWVG